MSEVIVLRGGNPRTPFDRPTPAERETFLAGLHILRETANQPRHAPTIMVRQFGSAYIALNPKAEVLAMHERGDPKKPFSEKLLRLAADLGFNVEVVRGA